MFFFAHLHNFPQNPNIDFLQIFSNLQVQREVFLFSLYFAGLKDKFQWNNL